MKKLVLILLVGILAVGGVLAGISCGSTSGEGPGQEGQDSTAHSTALGEIGKTKDNPVPLGTPLALSSVGQELMVLEANEVIHDYYEHMSEPIRLKYVTITVEIKAIDSEKIVKYYSFNFKLVGLEGIVYDCDYFHRELLSGSSKIEDLKFSIDNSDDSDFLLIWEPYSDYGPNPIRFFALAS